MTFQKWVARGRPSVGVWCVVSVIMLMIIWMTFYKKNSRASVVGRSLNVHVIFSIPLSGFRGKAWVKM